ncbi:hypothetical protein D3C72_1329840 [compost metagenome]
MRKSTAKAMLNSGVMKKARLVASTWPVVRHQVNMHQLMDMTGPASRMRPSWRGSLRRRAQGTRTPSSRKRPPSRTTDQSTRWESSSHMLISGMNW